jgi:predicted amidohydrolase YtcJ
MRFLMALVVMLLPATASAAADLIYYGGTIETLDASFRRVQAIAVLKGKIIAVGDYNHVVSYADKTTRYVNLRRRTLLPGFVDPHNHLFTIEAKAGMSFDQTQQYLLTAGITTLGELAVTEDHLDAMRAFHATHRLYTRTSLYPVRNDACGEESAPFYLDFPPETNTSSRLRIPGIKIFTDGGSCNYPASTFDYPLPGGPVTGDLYFPETEVLHALIVEAQDHGYQVALHAIGDLARDVALDAIELALDGGANTLRHRIEHTIWVRPDQIARYAQLGVIATGYIDRTCMTNAQMTPLINTMPAYAQAWYRPWAEMITAHVALTWKSDLPGQLSEDIIQHLYNIVTRREVDDDGTICQPPAWFAQTGNVTTGEALKMMTIAGAFALGMESVVGSLEVGKFADFIVLSADPLAVAPADLKDLRVLSTVIGGVRHYCAPGNEWLCQ